MYLCVSIKILRMLYEVGANEKWVSLYRAQPSTSMRFITWKILQENVKLPKFLNTFYTLLLELVDLVPPFFRGYPEDVPVLLFAGHSM